MKTFGLGRTGLIVLAIVVLILGVEDVLIWYNSGAFPALKFLLIDVLVVGIVAAVIIDARRRQLP